MASIKEINQELRHREWSEKIQECQNSGMTVKEWCESSGIKLSTYYSRLKAVRKETLSRQPELHSIVPVSISTELSENPVLPTAAVFSDTYDHSDKIIIRKNGVEIELPCNTSEHTISAMLRGLKEC